MHTLNYKKYNYLFIIFSLNLLKFFYIFILYNLKIIDLIWK